MAEKTELIKKVNDDIQESKAINLMCKCIEKRGLSYGLRIIGNVGNNEKNENNNVTPLESDGIYLMFGTSKETVENFNDLSEYRFYHDEYKKQHSGENTNFLFPKCQIIKLDGPDFLVRTGDALEYAMMFEFLKEKMSDFGFKKNVDKISDALLGLAITYYMEATNLEAPDELRKASWEGCRLVFEFINSGEENVDDFFKKRGLTQTKRNASIIHEVKSLWESKSENNIESDDLFQPSTENTSTAIKKEFLKEFEEFAKINGIKYHIVPEPVIYNDFGKVQGKDAEYLSGLPQASTYYKVEHDANDSGLIKGFVYSRTFKFLSPEEHSKKELTNLEAIRAGQFKKFLIPLYWVKTVTQYLQDVHADYVYDRIGSVCASTGDAFGIVTFDDTNEAKVQRACALAIEIKAKYKYVDHRLEKLSLGTKKEQEEALEELRQSKMKTNNMNLIEGVTIDDSNDGSR